VSRYGGFHCLTDDEPEAGGSRASEPQSMASWRGRVEAQFQTLKQMSPRDRKVVGVAIAGFGHCNDQREFLGQLKRRRGFEAFELKQCGDATDMERWLSSEGYRINPECTTGGGEGGDRALASRGGARQVGSKDSFGGGGPLRDSLGANDPPTAMNSLVGGAAAPEPEPKVGLWASILGTTAIVEASRRERVLGDVHRIVEETRGLEAASGLERLREAELAVQAALVDAREAGVEEDELQDAELRRSELAILVQSAARPAGCWPWFCCCCNAGAAPNDLEQAALLQSRPCDAEADLSPSSKHQERLRFLEEQVNSHMGEITRLRAEEFARLPVGTKCMYYSSSWQGWVPAVVVGFDDGSYDLDVRRHAKLENITPVPGAKRADAWPAGVWVSYQSDSAGGYINAVVKDFAEGAEKVGGSVRLDGTYDLDVKRRAVCSRIRPRL